MLRILECRSPKPVSPLEQVSRRAVQLRTSNLAVLVSVNGVGIIACYEIVGVMPPSTRNAAPFVAAESGLATNATKSAISSGSIMRCSNELERLLRKNSASISSGGREGSLETLFKKSTMPSDRVGPGRIEFTVTPVPLVNTAKPRDMASCAVFVMP